jgi:hypothetical protein
VKRAPWALASAFALATAACNHVGSSVSAPDSVNGEAWYVRTISFAGLTFSASVWYCAPPSARGHIACKEVVLHDAEDGTVPVQSDPPKAAPKAEPKAEAPPPPPAPVAPDPNREADAEVRVIDATPKPPPAPKK